MAGAGAAIAATVAIALAVSRWHDVGLLQGGLLALGLGVYFPLSAYWGLLDSRGETAFTGGVRSAAWTATYLAFIALAWVRMDVLWYVAAMALMNVAILAAYAGRLYRRHSHGPARMDWTLAREIWGHSVDNLIFNACAFVLGSTDRFMLGWQRGTAALGLYSGVYELTTKPAAFLRVLAAVLYPEAARSDDKANFLALWLPFLKLIFFGSASVAFFAVLYRESLVQVILGTKFAPVADPFGLLAIGFVMVSLGYLAAVPLQGQGNFRIMRNIYLVAACFMALAAWPAIAFGGTFGAAGLYLATRSVDLFMLRAAFRKLGRPLSALEVAMASALFCGTFLAGWLGHPIVGLLCLCALGAATGIPALARELSEIVRQYWTAPQTAAKKS